MYVCIYIYMYNIHVGKKQTTRGFQTWERDSPRGRERQVALNIPWSRGWKAIVLVSIECLAGDLLVFSCFGSLSMGSHASDVGVWSTS